MARWLTVFASWFFQGSAAAVAAPSHTLFSEMASFERVDARQLVASFPALTHGGVVQPALQQIETAGALDVGVDLRPVSGLGHELGDDGDAGQLAATPVASLWAGWR